VTLVPPEIPTSPAGRFERIPAVWLVVGGILSVQFGAAIAKGLFGLVPPTAMVWMRLATSALILLAVVRPSFRGRSRRDWTVALAFGTALMTMNWAIYQSFAEIPLGVAVTLEFLGPLTVAGLGSRRPGDLIWVGLGGLGVALLGFSPVGLTLRGALFALLAAAAWAAYILLSKQTGARWPGLSGLAIASLVGFVVLAPPAIIEAGAVLLSPQVLVIGVTVGLLSSVIPYSLELTALRRITPRLFGILMSLEPAAAALAAVIVLREWLTFTQWLALVCVVAASVGATRTSPPPLDEPLPD
jgi:inner membrane transporter RhtA